MAKQTTVEVIEFAIREVVVPIIGISPLITHAWSSKAIKMIKDRQDKKAGNKKHELRDQEEEYEMGKHKSPLGWEGFPASGFKASMIRGAKMIGMVMKDTQTGFFIKANCEETQLVKINGESRLRTDMVKVGMGASDIRYRPEYVNWSAELTVEFNAGVLSVSQIFQLVKAAGYGCGIGEMRPGSTKFNYGRFRLSGEQDGEMLSKN